MDKIVEFMFSALVGALTLYICRELIIPLIGGWVQEAPPIRGKWKIRDTKDGSVVGEITISQIGKRLKAKSSRMIERDGSEISREFTYKGSINGSKIHLHFDTKGGAGFYSGVMCLKLNSGLDEIKGITSYYDDDHSKVTTFPIYYSKC
ncbi:hypothetical protein E1100_11585 [Vibrio owensii]|uniref:hypothetical protein n=1 Tax=Vibrio owensii TaxID=696485 RepID=UPI001049F88E|nr:hypothetical protein [Vibrio owensii]TDE23463.1 hypothetical protein E1100_11585 [Vibrio owensii]